MRDIATRRRFLGLVSTTAAVGLAGCTDAGGSDGGDGGSDGGDGGDGSDDEYRNGVSADASVSFNVPGGGTDLTSRYVTWAATADGVDIEESGEVNEGAGHYHIMVDTEPVEPGETIPSDDSHVHYGTGQTDGVLELEPGDHTLHLQVGDGEHTAMALTDTVEVSVSESAELTLDTTVDGSVVEWDITAENYDIVPSSDGFASNAGHLHAIIDAEHVPVGEVIPSDDRHVHFGDGSTSGSLDLAEQLGDDYEAGEHTIHFQVGTASHRATMVHVHTTVTTE
jgi:hypothetical protein